LGSDPKFIKTGATSSKVRHAGAFLTVKDAAQQMGLSVSTVTRWCESGKLPAIAQPYGQKWTYLISLQTVEMLLALESQKKKESLPQTKTAPKPHAAYLNLWRKAMGGGAIGGKVFSPRTIEAYWFYAKPFIEQYQTLSVDSLQAALMRVSPQNFSKRLKIYESMVCFGKFLCANGVLDDVFIEGVKPLRPKRHIPPKRTVVDAEGVATLQGACETPLESLIVTLLTNTGLRASEACSLRLRDIDLSGGYLTVERGKGGKRRQVGLSAPVIRAIIHFVTVENLQNPSGYLLRDIKGQPMNRHGLFQRLERIGKRADIKVSPHALRRAFVTINAGKGRPLVYLQRACGHSDIKTTMGYCRTSEEEVISAMQSWD
jgi:excisionase family DNA binding protein